MSRLSKVNFMFGATTFILQPNFKLLPLASTLSALAHIHAEQHAFMKSHWRGDLGQDIFRIENCSRFMPIKIVVAYVFRKTTLYFFILEGLSVILETGKKIC